MMMTIMHHRFRVISLILFISFCSTPIVEEAVIENTTSTSTTIEEVVQDEVISTSTTTTIAKQANNINYSKEVEFIAKGKYLPKTAIQDC